MAADEILRPFGGCGPNRPTPVRRLRASAASPLFPRIGQFDQFAGAGVSGPLPDLEGLSPPLCYGQLLRAKAVAQIFRIRRFCRAGGARWLRYLCRCCKGRILLFLGHRAC